MELVYAFGIRCIQFIQERFSDLEWFFDILNVVYIPHAIMEYAVPVVSAIDSVFAAQLLLSMAFGSWANTMLKWILVEERPYWWVRETTYYDNHTRPIIRHGVHTCETSPGSPSGHVAAAATMFMLVHMWCSHVVNDLRLTRVGMYFNRLPHKMIYFAIMFNVALARMYAGAHFPHQCLMGGLVGSLISPTICLFITDPYLFRPLEPQQVTRTVVKHVVFACALTALAMLLIFMYMVLKIDLHWATRLAFRWCTSPEHIHVKSTPVFSMIQSTGSLIGWALVVTPEITKFRHNTHTKNSLVAITGTIGAMYFFRHLQEMFPNRRFPFYALHFAMNVAKPFRHNTHTKNSLVAITGTIGAMYFFRHIQEMFPNRRFPFYALHFAMNVAKPYVYLRMLPAASLKTYLGGAEPVPMPVQITHQQGSPYPPAQRAQPVPAVFAERIISQNEIHITSTSHLSLSKFKLSISFSLTLFLICDCH